MLYARFETVLDGLGRLGFFLDGNLVAAVEPSMVGPRPASRRVGARRWPSEQADVFRSSFDVRQGH
jgi:hypothetical protein